MRDLGAVPVFAATLAAACAHRAPTPEPAPAPRPPAAPPSPSPVLRPKPAVREFGSLSAAEPALVSAEDRRAYDAVTLVAAATSPDASVRARAALSLGRIGDARAV